MNRHHRSSALATFSAVLTIPALAVTVSPSAAGAQIGGIVRGAVNREIGKKIDHAITCAFNDQDCISKAKADGKPIVVTDAHGKKVSSADSAKAVAGGPSNAPGSSQGGAASGLANPDGTAFVNYDFIPGDTVLFAEDFSNDKIGDLPSRVNVQSGNWEVADYLGQRFLRSTSGGRVMIPLPATLPEKFTLEFDLIHYWAGHVEVWFMPQGGSDWGVKAAGGDYNYTRFGANAGIGAFTSSANFDGDRKLYHARIMADGEHVKVYENGKRVANVPEGKLGRSAGMWIVMGEASDDHPNYITNIRVAKSNASLFDALNANGRVATHGILFDVNSDRIRAESAPTLQEIGDMLKQHADLKVTIEGHTDSTGNALGNQTLSETRAAAVKNYLVSTYGIAAARLDAKGFGASRPAVPNTTAEGRQQNRRVELVKM